MKNVFEVFIIYSYVMDKDKKKAPELRQVSFINLLICRFISNVLVSPASWGILDILAWCCCCCCYGKVIAAAVASNKEKYNEAFLGKQNEEYCAWILNPDKWGGTHIVVQHVHNFAWKFSSFCVDEVSFFFRIFCFVIGAIELSILADYYGREIGAYDIQTSRCDLYGQVSIISSSSNFQTFQIMKENKKL